MRDWSHVTAIINPFARIGRMERDLDALNDALRSSFPGITLLQTEAPGHAVELAGSVSNEGSLVIACGGDGTVHEVARGLIESSVDTTMAVLPMGSGNDYARALRMHDDWREAVLQIALGRIIRSDAGRATWEEEGQTHSGLFVNALGVGFDAHAAVLAPNYKGWPFGIGYTVSILQALRTWISAGATIRTTGPTSEVIFNGRLMFVTIGNAFDSGGGYTVNPGALISDGFLDPCIVEDISVLRCISLMPRVRSGDHIGMDEVTYVRTEGIHIDSDRGLPMHADGEILSRQARNIRVDVEKAVLPVVVPADAKDPL